MKQRVVAIALAGFCLVAASPPSAAGKVELTTRVSGVVDEVLVKPGQRVKRGAVLLRLAGPFCRRALTRPRRSRCVRRPMKPTPSASLSVRRNCSTAPCHRAPNSTRPRCATRVHRQPCLAPSAPCDCTKEPE